jgi:hypothetical protein
VNPYINNMYPRQRLAYTALSGVYMKAFYLLLIPMALLSGCRKEHQPPPPAPEPVIEMRVENRTSFTLNDCTIDPEGTLSNNPGPKAHNYGTVPVGQYSAYHSFNKIYRYSWIRVVMSGNTLYQTPYDYTGETPLTAGRYTYKISFSAPTGQLVQELLKD